MKIFSKYLGLIAAFASLLSCEKTEEPAYGDYISFYIYDENFSDPGTKAIVEDTRTMKNLGLKLWVSDMAGLNQGNTDINAIEVDYNSETDLYRSDETWKSRDYEFFAYTLSKGSGEGTNVALFDNYKGLKGHSVDIYEPTEYKHDDKAWSDYLLSYRTPAVGSQQPLVRLEMERITTGVELYVSTPKGSKAVVTSVEFTDITRSMRYTITSHAVTDPNLSGIRNSWMLQSISETSNPIVTYSRTDTDGLPVEEKTESDDRFDSKFLMMRFIAVKQAASGDLRIKYRINETGSEDVNTWPEYQAEFDLSMTSIPTWEIGRKTRYYISLDTSVELEGVIAEWKYIDYVEGTFLPNITQ